MQIQKTVLCLLLAAVSFADINTDYQNILHGQQELTQQQIDQMYEQFVAEYQHQAPSANVLKDSPVDRKGNFEKTLKSIVEHNQNPSYKYKKGINAFSDMTDEEFIDYFRMVNAPQHCSATYYNQRVEKKFDLQEIPSHWDWRIVGGVSPVKDQGHCGSCWTFSTVGAMEAHFMLKYNQFRNLSEQQLVDCAGAYDNNGCNGGLPSHAFQYINDVGGLTTEDQYAYTAEDGSCKFNIQMSSVGVRGGSVNITQGDENELLHALFEHGPVSVSYQVIDGFKDYKSGVYHADNCGTGPMDVNHAVLAVGFGHQDGMDYWIIKNSWGTSFGEDGYFKIQRGVNMCAISQCNSYPKNVIRIRIDGQEDLEEFTQ